jgi:hypothetical protein
MNLCTLTAISVLSTQPFMMAPAASWSPDGSAEAATLRARAQTRAVADASASDDTRGMGYVVDPSVPSPPPPAAPIEQPADDDVTNFDGNDFRRNYELEKIAKRGRSFFVPGVVLTTLGTIFVIGALAGIADEANPVTGGLLGGSLALSAIGWPLLVVGVKMRKHPERYVKDRRTATLSPGGFTVRF